MRRAVDQMIRNNKKATFVLQLTAMVDMFTILIVFLLKSYSTSAVHITPREGLKLPTSTSYTAPVEALKLIVAQEGIFLDEKKVISFKEGVIALEDVDPKDPDFIQGLYEELDKHAEKSKAIAGQNEEFVFEGKVIMQADSRLKYELLKKIMYTTSLAGYADMKLATFSAH